MANFQARHNLTSDQYQQTFNQLTSEGFRLKVVSGYEAFGQPRFAAIFVQEGGPASQARHNLTSGQYQQTFDQLTAEGFRPKVVSGYEAGGQLLFAALFEQDGGPGFQARHNLSADQYQQTFNQMTAEGFRPALVDGYEVNGQPFFAAVFEQGGGPPFQARHNLTSGQYQQTFDQLTAEGFRPKVVSGYEAFGQSHFAAIFEQVGGAAFQARHDLTADQYQQTFDQLTSEGFQPVWVNGYEVGGQDRFAAIFEQ